MTQLVSLPTAVELILSGHVVAIPTETVYGIAADATNDKAVASIYSLKSRPKFNPLIVHVPNLEAAEKLAEFSPLAKQMAAAFWPGPLTLVLPLKLPSPLSKLVTAGLSTLAIRIPQHPTALTFLQQVKCPLAAPSANPSGRLSPTTAAHVMAMFENIDLAVLEGEGSTVGLESTIVDLTHDQPAVLRYGGLSIDEIRKILPDIKFAEASDTIKAPGQLLRHYAPKHKLRLNATNVLTGEALLAFGTPLMTTGPMLNLSPKGDLIEAASHLFSYLHQLDELAYITTIAVMPVPEMGLGFAINDRLKRGANT